MKPLTKAMIKWRTEAFKNTLLFLGKQSLELAEMGLDVASIVKPTPEVLAAKKVIDLIAKKKAGRK